MDARRDRVPVVEDRAHHGDGHVRQGTVGHADGNTGFRTAAQGVEVAVHLATLPADGPGGQLWGYRWGATGDEEYGALPW